MSVFYCMAHHKLEDSDFVGYYVIVGDEGEEKEVCDEGQSLIETQTFDNDDE